MAVQDRSPKATDYKDEQAARGSGKLDSVHAYLRQDPINYYHETLKGSNNPYMREDMWYEAAQRGESEGLIMMLQKNQQGDNQTMRQLDQYKDRLDYDTYMLALQTPFLDDTKAEERKSGDYSFGNFTDKQWAIEIINENIKRYEAEITEERKANMNFFEKAGATIVSGINHVTGGIVGFFQDLYNLGEGVVNMFVNFSDDKNLGDRFLYAWSNDDGEVFAEIKQYIDTVNYQFELEFTNIVNAVDAYEQGYRAGDGSNYFEQINNTVGVGAGYTTWGRWWTAGTESIGYMIPAMTMPVSGLGRYSKYAKSGLFYTGIASSMIGETVNSAAMNGISYKDLNAGQVVANAVLKAGTQYAIEKVLGLVLGFSGLDRMMGTAGKTATKGAAKAATRTGAAAVGTAVMRGARDMIKEGLEETLQSLSDGIIDYAFGGIYRSQGQQNLSMQTLVDSFVVGALTSGVVGSLKGATVLLPGNRGFAIDKSGKAYKMGIFQSLNYREAVAEMQGWNEVLNDNHATLQAKIDAAFKMNGALQTLGSVMKAFGPERLMNLNSVLNELGNSKRTEAIKQYAGKSAINYAKDLFADFQKAQAKASAKYMSDKLLTKATKAAEKRAEKLRKAGVTKVEETVTSETVSNDPNLQTKPETNDVLKQALSGLGVEAIIGVDGKIVTRSDEVVFVENQLLLNGDIAEIVKGIAFELAQETVSANLTDSQLRLITEAYSKVSGTDGTVDDALTALLFDKSFYTFVLLQQNERRYKTAAFEMLATIDKLVKAELLPEVDNGRVTKGAYKVLIEKIQSTMRTGLITYATQYTKIDLGVISNEVISADVKAEIQNHRNVMFTDRVDGIVTEITTGDEIDQICDKYAGKLMPEEFRELKRKAHSNLYNERVDAKGLLTQLAKFDKKDQGKLVYLPSDTTDMIAMEQVQNVADFYGVEWIDLIDGTYDVDALTPEAIDFIVTNGYEMGDPRQRLAAIRETLFDKSGKTLTLGINGEVIQVIDKFNFLKPEYLNAKGEAKLLKALKDKTIKNISDIAKITLPEEFPDLELRLDTNMKPGINGEYVNGSGVLWLSGKSIVDTVMHEATHATQDILGVGTQIIGGGTPTTFVNLPKTVQESLTKYISENFQLTYNYLKAHKASSAQIIYFLLSGELQANSTISSHMFQIGFAWENGRSTLVSPDGKQKWSMAADKRIVHKGLQSLLSKLQQPQVEPGAPTDVAAKQEPEVSEDREFVSNQQASRSNLKFFVRKGTPIQMDSGVSAFITNTTKDFNKLPKVLKDKITSGTLNKFDIIKYVATASNMNDYTFQAIARDVYKNPALAKITFKDMQKIANSIEEYAALSYIGNNAEKQMSPVDMANVLKATFSDGQKDSEISKAYEKGLKRARTVRVKHGEKASYVESTADALQLHPIFFRHYDGTLSGIRDINNLGKFMAAQQLEEGIDDTRKEGNSKVWNWQDQLRRAEVEYEQDPDISDSLDGIDKQTKINTIIDYANSLIIQRIQNLPEAERRAKGAEALAQLKKETDIVHELDDVTLNQRYLAAIANETAEQNKRLLQPIIAKAPEGQRTTKNRKDLLRNLGRTITVRVAGLKTRYNSLPEEVKKHIDEKTYRLTSDYQNMSDTELEELITHFQKASTKLRERIRKVQIQNEVKRKTAERMAKQAERMIQVTAKGQEKDTTKKTMREKIQVVYKTKIVEQTFSFESGSEANSRIKKLLDTVWSKSRTSTVKGLTNNQSQNVANGKEFFTLNADTLMSMSTQDAEQDITWFLDARMNNVTDEEYRKFQAIKLYLFGYVYSQIKDGGQFYGFNSNLKQRMENYMKADVSVAGTTMAVWNNLQDLINPLKAMANADLEIDGVLLTTEEKTDLMNAGIDGDIKKIAEIQARIIDRVEKERTGKKGFLRRITAYRRMAMLSSPMTWLRNFISNSLLKRFNKLSSSIGNRVLPSRHFEGQLRLTGAVTPQIQNFINEHFIDNGLFKELVNNLSKYNPSEIDKRFKDSTGKANKDAIFANMVIKSMYNKYYSENIFKSKRMNSVHKWLMARMSDDNYVREASIRYFGKILAEKGYDLQSGVTDSIMNDFANAIGLGMADYMHSDNIMNKIEAAIGEKSELALFGWKMFMPFASAGWNWCKAAWRYSPMGLGQAIVRFTRLEKEIQKAELAQIKGIQQVSPEMTEYLIRRDLGSGVIGTIGFTIGAILAGLGYMDIEDDDYGVPKLRIGNLTIDISSIFGSGSILTGAAMISGWTKGDFMEGLDRGAATFFEGFFLTDMLAMDLYTRGGWASFGLDFFESTLLSYIPNGLAWVAGGTYSGNLDKQTLWGKAAAKIPFLGPVLNEKKVNPYDGSTGSWIDALNRMIPYFSIQTKNKIQKEAELAGVSKTQLRGAYEVNGERFSLGARQTAELNRLYGEWNAAALTAFYNGETRYTVKVNNRMVSLRYDQMTVDQRKRVIDTIMSKNANYAKIKAWLTIGKAYYASAAEFAELRKLGITGKIYIGNKGFSDR